MNASWVIASHNQGKLGELRTLLGQRPVSLQLAPALELPVPDETGSTFEDNAILKAVAAMNATGLPALSDDSGVVVHALGGRPGIDTALWAGRERDFAIARRRVQDELDALGPNASRRTTWVTVLCLALPDGAVETFRGETHGALVWPTRPDTGAGFEPMFLPDGFAVTYAEMTPALRRRVNARAQAMRKLERATFGT
ncbi:MAG: non-canonical purine NTP pyrophosphatase [Myxococcota bacterium]